MIKNVFYFDNLYKCGGIETFEYYLAREYNHKNDIEIEIWYKTADSEQLSQMMKYANCVKFVNQKIVCDNFFFPSRCCGDILNYVKANNIIECFHMAKAFNWNTKVDNRVNKYIAVSYDGAKIFEKATNKKCDCYYPVISYDKSLKKVNTVNDNTVRLVSIGRFDSDDKGAARMKVLADTLDSNNVKWEWSIYGINNALFTNSGFSYKGIILDKEKLFKELIKSDFGVQLSDAEGFGIAISEILNLGLILVSTPVSVLDEHLVDDNNCIIYNFDNSNISDVISKLLGGWHQHEYSMPRSDWKELLSAKNRFLDCWWSEDVWNAGDYFGHWILNKVGLYNTYNEIPKIVGSGSILGFKNLNKDTVSWGVGYHNEDDIKRPLLKNILSVRGYYTKNKIEKYHNVVIDDMVIGDTGLLVSKFYKPTTTKIYKWGIICHYIDYDMMKNLYKDNDDVYLISMSTHNIEKLIDDINKCEFIFSSSLHGLIFSHSLGIPAVHLEINKLYSRNNWKFKDYYSSIGIEYVKEIFKNDLSFVDKYINDSSKYLPNNDVIINIQNNLLEKIYEYRDMRYS